MNGYDEWFEFTPLKSGYHEFELSGDGFVLWADLYDGSYDPLEWIGNAAGFNGFYFGVNLEANTTYYLKIGYNDYLEIYSLSVKYEHDTSECSITRGPKYEEHVLFNGHFEKYYCVLGCDEHITNYSEYFPDPNCPSCDHEHTYSQQMTYGYHTFNGHERKYECTKSDCVEYEPDGDEFLPDSCASCFWLTIPDSQKITKQLSPGYGYEFLVSVENVTDFNGITYTFVYDSVRFELVNACGLAWERITDTGPVYGTDITIVNITEDKLLGIVAIEFTCDKQIQPGQSFFGTVNIINLQAKSGYSGRVGVSIN